MDPERIGVLLGQALQRNDAAEVAQILGHRKAPSPFWKEPLLRESHPAQQIRRFVRRRPTHSPSAATQQGEETARETTTPSLLSSTSLCDPDSFLILQSLLISPSGYETPWKAACQLLGLILGLEWSEGLHTSNEEEEEQDRWDDFLVEPSLDTTLSPNYSCSLLLNNHPQVQDAVSDLQRFLQQTVAHWWDEDRRQGGRRDCPNQNSPSSTRPGEQLSPFTPRDYLIRWVYLLMKPVLLSSPALSDRHANEKGGRNPLDTSHATEHPAPDPPSRLQVTTFTIVKELMTSILTVCRDLDSALHQECWDIVFGSDRSTLVSAPRLRPDRFVLWIEFAVELRLWLRAVDWESIQSHLHAVFSITPCPIPGPDLPVLATHLVSLFRSAMEACRDSSEIKQKPVVPATPWVPSCRECLWQILWLSAPNISIYDQVETAIEASLSSLPASYLLQWTESIIQPPPSAPGSTLAEWVQANTLLLTIRASQRSGSEMVSRLCAWAFKRPQPAMAQVKDLCWTRLVQLATPRRNPKAKWRLPPRRNKTEGTGPCQSNLWRLKELFRATTYQNQGSFHDATDSSETWMEMLTQTGSLVFHSLSVGRRRGELQVHNYDRAAERARTWLLAASNVLTDLHQGWDEQDNPTLITSIVVVVVLYRETSACRVPLLVDMVKELTAESSTSECLSNVYCIVLDLVLESDLGEPAELELDQLVTMVSPSISLNRFVHLARSLARSSALRQRLLTFGSDGLADSMLKVQWHGFDKGDSVVVDRICCNLAALIPLLGAGGWNELEIIACEIVSNTIVDKGLKLPLGVRSWLYIQLKVAIGNQQIHKQALPCLLRACLLRLLQFIESDVCGRSSIVLERCFISRGTSCQQVEDIVSLYDLTMSLLFHLSGTSSSDSTRKDVLVGWRHRICAEIVVRTKIHSNPSLPLQVAPCIADDEFLPCHVAMMSIELLVRAALRCANDQPFPADYPSVETMLALISTQQDRYFVANLGKEVERWNCAGAVGSLPDGLWRRSFDRSSIDSLLISLCDVVVEFLIGPRWTELLKQKDPIDPPVDQTNSVLRACSILSLKRALSRNVRETREMAVTYSEDIRFEAMETIFVSLNPILIQSYTEEAPLEHVAPVLGLVLNLENEVKFDLERLGDWSTSRRCRRILSVLRSVYSATSSEEGSTNLIKYLRRHLPADPLLLKEPVSSSDLPNLLHEADVDTAARSVRLSVLSAARTWFSRIHDILTCPQSDGSADFKAEDTIESMLDDQYIMQFLSQLCLDLRDGLGGASGGLTYELFEIYVDCVELCVAMQRAIAPYHSSDDKLASLIKEFVGASRRLQEVTAKHYVKQAGSFKKITMLTTFTIPSVLSSLQRCRLLSYSASQAETIQESDQSPSFLTRLISCCVTILNRKRMPHGRYEEIFGYHVATESNMDASDSDDDSSIVPLNALAGGPEGLDDGDGWMMDCGQTLLLWNEKALFWALSTVFTAFEKHFDESLTILDGTNEEFQDSAAAAAYFQFRRSHLNLVVRAIASVLESAPPSATAGAETFGAPALDLSPSVKSRLVASLERWVALGSRSTRMATTAVKQSLNMEKETCPLHVVEALAVVMAWCGDSSSRETRENVDITMGIRRWYFAERQKALDAQRGSSVMVTEPAILNKLPKVMGRLDELWRNLLQLDQTLREHKGGPAPWHSGFAMHRPDSEKPRTLAKSVAGQVRRLRAAHEKLGLDLGLDVSGGGPSTTSSGQKRAARELERTVQRERRRNHQVLRSRNGVIDQWLQMDRQVGVDGDRPEPDAYADLEDFLVEG